MDGHSWQTRHTNVIQRSGPDQSHPKQPHEQLILASAFIARRVPWHGNDGRPPRGYYDGLTIPVVHAAALSDDMPVELARAAEEEASSAIQVDERERERERARERARERERERARERERERERARERAYCLGPGLACSCSSTTLAQTLASPAPVSAPVPVPADRVVSCYHGFTTFAILACVCTCAQRTLVCPYLACEHVCVFVCVCCTGPGPPLF